MSEYVLPAGILLLTAVGAWLAFQNASRLRELRDAISLMASKELKPLVFPKPMGGLQGIATDLLHINERLLQQSRQLADEGFSLRAILSSMLEGVLLVDGSQRVRLVNESLSRVLGPQISPINRTLIEVFRKHELHNAVAQSLEDNAPQKIELEIDSYAEGRPKTACFEIHAVGLRPAADQPAIGAIVVFHDISAIRALESVRREFVANVSHEFRTPLSIINGYIETLLDGALEDPGMASRSLRAMHRHSQRLNLLIDDLLQISQIESRATSFSFEQVDIRRLVEHMIEQLEPQFTAKSAKVLLDFSEGDHFVEADPRRIEQALMNLLSNALQHGATDHTIIRVEGSQLDGRYRLQIADNGPGIPLADQPHIFERFYRVHKDRSRDAGGTGLGLSIVKNVVEAHGGQVGVESHPGAGSTFWFTLPLSQQGS